MGSYVAARAAFAIPMLLMISFLTFGLIQLGPMDPATAILQAQGVPQVTDELIALTRTEFGLDLPYWQRYGQWLAACLRLDFGRSYVTGEPVWSVLGPALAHTFRLTLVSLAAIVATSFALGAFCALKPGRPLDRSVRGISFVLGAMPPYWLAPMLIWLAAVKLDLLPTSGADGLANYVLPVTVLTAGYAGIYFRIVRSAMIGRLNEDYVLYGRACGLPERKVIARALRNSMQVAVSVFCMACPIILGSTVVVENVFAWPGVGFLSVKAIMSRDVPIIQAYVIVLAAVFVLFNLLADIAGASLNPKLRRGSQ
ncbi:nickel/cobalt ABC transporter permease [Cohnella sp. GCM10027633]|uniref:nickel/cobalt ABC transporter permease n=1 Tax=unclassified Cohnella TaxID=2636738 RepID=UPI00362E7527